MAELPLSDAVIVTDLVVLIVPAVAPKLAAVAPAATVTEEGSDNAVRLSEMDTLTPLDGAATVRLTEQVLAPPEVRTAGAHCSVLIFVDGTTVIDAVAEVALSEAERVAEELDVTEPAVAVKTADEEPAGTLAEAGTLTTAVFDDDSATVAPPVGAACVRVTVHVEVPLDATVVGEHCSVVTVAIGVTAKEAVADVLFKVAVMVAD